MKLRGGRFRLTVLDTRRSGPRPGRLAAMAMTAQREVEPGEVVVCSSSAVGDATDLAQRSTRAGAPKRMLDGMLQVAKR
jgi:hypothetical protein